MKKLMVITIIVCSVIIAGVLYGTHSLIIEEKSALSLEQAYMAHYPAEIPNVTIHAIPYGAF